MPESSRSVAIVDDDVDLVKTYELIFRKKQVPVAFVAYDGVTGLDKFRSMNTKPGVVIVDYRMPVMGGLELTREIKKLDPRTKIVFVSADDTVGPDALKSGADICLKKPVGVKAILNSIT